MKKILLTLTAITCIAIFVKAQNNQPGCYPYPKTISVTGSAEMEIIPDEIYVQVDLREYKKRGEKKRSSTRSNPNFSPIAEPLVLPTAILR